jgi:D-glycero-alpha-D-manno-heptose 1-phosphate guanylyltransferase
MEAIVLAGGLGTRLRSVVPDLPKPMAPVAGRPFLAWVLDALADAGFARAVLAVGYRHEAIRDHFGACHRGLRLVYSVEHCPLGTGGAIRLAADAAGEWPVFVLNGDTWLDLDYGALWCAHESGGERLTVAACRVDDTSRYGALEVHDGHLRGLVEKGRSGPGLINAGTYLVSRDVVERIPRERVHSFEQQLLVPGVRDLSPAVFVADGAFIDIGVPEDYARAQPIFESRARHP